MPLIEITKLRSELGYESTNQNVDDLIVESLDRAVAWLVSQCGNPFDAGTNTIYPFSLDRSQLRKVVPYRFVNSLISVEKRTSVFEEWSDDATVALAEVDDVPYLIHKSGWEAGTFYRAELSVGFTSETLPGDIAQMLVEWIHLRLVENREVGDKRFGKAAAGDGKAGLSSSTTYDPEKLELRWERILKKYRNSSP